MGENEMDKLTYEYMDSENVMVIRLRGSLFHNCVKEIEGALFDLVPQCSGVKTLLALSQTLFLDRVGWALITARHFMIEEEGGELVITGMSDPVDQSFDHLGLDRFIHRFPDPASALNASGLKKVPLAS